MTSAPSRNAAQKGPAIAAKVQDTNTCEYVGHDQVSVKLVALCLMECGRLTARRRSMAARRSYVARAARKIFERLDVSLHPVAERAVAKKLLDMRRRSAVDDDQPPTSPVVDQLDDAGNGLAPPIDLRPIFGG
jgi:hypothetical protein